MMTSHEKDLPLIVGVKRTPERLLCEMDWIDAANVQPELPPPSKADGEAGEVAAEGVRRVAATPIEDEGGGVIGEARG